MAAAWTRTVRGTEWPQNSPGRFHGPHTARHERSDRGEGKTRLRRLHAEPRGPAKYRPLLATPAHARDGAATGSAADLSARRDQPVAEAAGAPHDLLAQREDDA